MTGHLDAFREALLSHGIDPGPVVYPGKHRCNEQGRRDKSCEYRLTDMGSFAYMSFINYREGIWRKHTNRNGQGYSEEERRAWAKRQAELEAQTKSAEAKAKDRAAYIWAHSTPAPAEHPYLVKKGIGPHNARVYKGLLAIPVMNEGELFSAQLISADGTKRFLKGGRTTGGYCEIPGTGTPIVGEGFASLASTNEATGAPCFVAFSCGNLEPVAEMLVKKYWPKVVIAADNDQWTTKPDGTPWNPGREKALALGWRLNCKVAIPEFPISENKLTDFNDLATLEGPEVVKKQIQAALLPQDWLLKECQEHGPGAAWRPENIQGLRLLRERDPATYRDLRERLRRLRVGVTELERELTKARTWQDGTTTGSHLELAEKTVQSFGQESILYVQGFFWIYNDKGLWERSEDRPVKAKIQAITRNNGHITRASLDSILDMCKSCAYKNGHAWNTGESTVNVLNGELSWNGERWTLGPHVRDHFRTTQIPVVYDPEARAPLFEKFLSEIFFYDPDKLDKSILVCEGFGYSLLSTAAFEKFFLLFGPGANGKSVLIYILVLLVGVQNVAAVQPSQFDNKFQRAFLFEKLVNIVSELAHGATISDNELKAITSGELSTVEFKHRAPFTFRPYATCWFLSNFEPRTKDYTDAFFRRALPITFNRVFSEPEQDKKLKHKLREELPGILNLALEAVGGVLKRGTFTTPKSTLEFNQTWRLNVDQVRQFLEDECELKPGLETPSAKLFEAYKTWAAENDIKRTVNRNTFTMRICNLGAVRARGAGGERLLAGIGLKYRP